MVLIHGSKRIEVDDSPESSSRVIREIGIEIGELVANMGPPEHRKLAVENTRVLVSEVLKNMLHGEPPRMAKFRVTGDKVKLITLNRPGNNPHHYPIASCLCHHNGTILIKDLSGGSYRSRVTNELYCTTTTINPQTIGRP